MLNTYVRFELKNGQEEKELLEALSSLGYNFEAFGYATQAFFQEEASFRLDMYEEHNEVEVDDDVREKVLEDIAEALFDDDYVIDSERIDDIVADVLKEWSENVREIEQEIEEIDNSIFVDESAFI